MAIDTVFILSQLGDLIALRTYRGNNRKNDIPQFYNQFTRRFRGQQQDREYPIIKIKEHVYAFITSADILIGAITEEDMPVLQIYAILFHILDVLKAADQGLSAERLKSNFSGVELMLDSFLDYGYPLIPQKFVLESIVKPGSVMEKIEQAIVGRNNIQRDQFKPLDCFIEQVSDVRDYAQYRISDIKGDEEVLFDVIEYMDCVVDKNGHYIVEEINGEIKMECNLSGTPELFIFLNQPIPFSDYSVHESLLNKISTYEREKVLNLIPPTGSNTIFYYNIKGSQVRVPFDFLPRLSITENSAHLELKIANRPVRGSSYKIEEFHIKITTPLGMSLGETTLQSGQLNQLENAILWKIGKLDIDQSTKLVAQFSTNKHSQGNYIACIKFLINQYSSSGTKIEKVEVRNGSKSLVKKARNISKSGYYEIRLN